MLQQLKLLFRETFLGCISEERLSLHSHTFSDGALTPLWGRLIPASTVPSLHAMGCALRVTCLQSSVFLETQCLH